MLTILCTFCEIKELYQKRWNFLYKKKKEMTKKFRGSNCENKNLGSKYEMVNHLSLHFPKNAPNTIPTSSSMLNQPLNVI